MSARVPKVSLIVAMRNEERYIEGCLCSLAAQDYPAGALEVLVFDGGSTDRSWEIASRVVDAQPGWKLRENPGVTQSAGWNLGIEAATGDVIGIVSAHSEVAADYVSSAAETLERTGADMVGGPMRAAGHGAISQAVALATSTPFGVGGARFHYIDREEEVDTVYMGLCRQDVYRRFRFGEDMVRNQDDELSSRLRHNGGTIVCNPAIRSLYRTRATYRSLSRQYFQYGCWKVRVIQKHPAQARVHQFVPAAFVSCVLLSAAGAAVSMTARVALGSFLGVYAAANLGASLHARRGSDWRIALLLPVTFASLHVSYGLGFLVGLARFRSGWGTQAKQACRAPAGH